MGLTLCVPCGWRRGWVSTARQARLPSPPRAPTARLPSQSQRGRPSATVTSSSRGPEQAAGEGGEARASDQSVLMKPALMLLRRAGRSACGCSRWQASAASRTHRLRHSRAKQLLRSGREVKTNVPSTRLSGCLTPWSIASPVRSVRASAWQVPAAACAAAVRVSRRVSVFGFLILHQRLIDSLELRVLCLEPGVHTLQLTDPRQPLVLLLVPLEVVFVVVILSCLSVESG
jgi:hypothetical protein